MLKHSVLFFSLILFAPSLNAETTLRGVTVSSGNPQDYVDLAELGANLLRFHLATELAVDEMTLEEYEEWLSSGLTVLDTVISTCATLNIKVLVSLTSPPGGFASRESPPWHRIFKDSWAQEAIKDTWNTISSRYVSNSTVWGYDLLNEPAERGVTAGLLNWKTLVPELISVIRQNDTSKNIVIEPVYGNQAFITRLPLMSDPNIFISPHFYIRKGFKNQGLNGNPINVTYPKGPFNRRALISGVKKALTYQRKNNVNILVGEFSAPRWAPRNGAFKYLRDLIKLFEKYGWDWTYHAWREADVWSIEVGTDPDVTTPSPTMTNREQLLRSFFSRNS